MEQRKTVFVLGAGFSKSFCQTMPLLADITESLLGAAPETYPSLAKFLAELQSRYTDFVRAHCALRDNCQARGRLADDLTAALQQRAFGGEVTLCGRGWYFGPGRPD